MVIRFYSSELQNIHGKTQQQRKGPNYTRYFAWSNDFGQLRQIFDTNNFDWLKKTLLEKVEFQQSLIDDPTALEKYRDDLKEKDTRKSLGENARRWLDT